MVRVPQFRCVAFLLKTETRNCLLFEAMSDAGSARLFLTAEGLPAFPRLWPGFALAGLFLVVEMMEIRLLPPELQPEFSAGPLGIAVALGGFCYWLFCLHRLHRILAALAPGGYPISPAKAAYFHLIPFFNLFWVVHWPYVLVKFLKAQGQIQIINGQLLGLFFFLSVILGRLVDGALGLAGFFAVTTYITGKIRQQLEISNQTP